MSLTSNRATNQRWSAGTRGLLLTLFAILGACASGPASKEIGSTGVVQGDESAQVTSFDAPTREAYAQALSLMDAGEVAQAAPLFESLAQAHPTLIGARINLAIALTSLERYEEAQEVLVALLAERTELVEGWNQLGVVYRKQGLFLSARDAYEKALALDPDHVRAHYNAALLHDIYLHEYGVALEHYERYRMLTGEGDERIDGWIADMQRRVDSDQRTAGVVDDEF